MREESAATITAFTLPLSAPSEALIPPIPSVTLAPPLAAPTAAGRCSVPAGREATAVPPDNVDAGGTLKGLDAWLPTDGRLHPAGS